MKEKKFKKNHSLDVGLHNSLVSFPTRPPKRELAAVNVSRWIVGDYKAGRLQTTIAATLFTLLALLFYSANSIAEVDTKQPFTQKMYSINVPQQNVAGALNLLAEQTGVTFVFPYEFAETQQANVVVGRFTLMQALNELLQGSALTGGLTESGVVVISLKQKNGKGMGMNMKKKVLASTIAFFVGSGASGVMAQEDVNGDELGWLLEEVVVTASKRGAGVSIQDTAMAISALSGDTLNKRGLVGMGDYLSAVPGASILDQGPGISSVIIRGLSANPQNEGQDSSPVSGVYFGDVSIAGLGLTGNSADVKLVDMERVEVLRGPQGTLYGAGAMGGVVRNIPAAPSLEGAEGRLDFDYSNTGEEGGSNTHLKGVINIPLIKDVLAIRGVAYQFDDSGYYKNVAASDPLYSQAVDTLSAVAVDRDDVGSSDITGGRLGVLWQPTENLTINASYLNQEIKQDGIGQADPITGGTWTQARFQIRDASGRLRDEGFEDELEIISLTVDYDLGWASLSSTTSRVEENFVRYIDFSRSRGLYPNGQQFDVSADVVSEEIRLASQFDGPFQFLAGFFYENKDGGNENSFSYSGSDPSLSGSFFNTTPGELLLFNKTEDRNTKQKAFFGELYYDLTEEIRLTLGGRAFDYDRESISEFLPSALTASASSNIQKGSESDASYKAGIEYTPSDSILIYANWAEGFRLGYPVAEQANPICDVNGDGLIDGGNVTTDARLIASDFMETVELGGKFSFLDNRLTVNAALYDTDWEGIPLSVQFDTCAATINAGEAKSRGVELEIAYSLSENLLVTASSSYIDAELAVDAPVLKAKAGNRLPGSPRFNASLGLEYQFKLAGYESYVRSDYAYVGDFYNNVQETGTESGGYHKLNLKAGITVDQFDFGLYVNNLSNDDSFTWVDSESNQPNSLIHLRGNRLRPRTIGLNVSYIF